MKLQRDQYLSSNALFGASLLFLAPAALDWVFRGFSLELYDFILITGCAFLVLMAFGARWWSLAPSLLSTALVVTWILYQLWREIAWRPIDWITNVTCLLLVVLALLSSIIATFLGSRLNVGDKGKQATQ